MRINPKWGWFAAFTAVFAVCAACVFWGTWSLDMVPVMPDAATVFSSSRAADWLLGWSETGKFVPGDLIVFLGSPYFWVELQYAIAAYFAALGMAYFLSGRGLSPLASYGAGLLLAFCGYWFTLFSAGHLGWFQWMTYGVFAFGLADRALEKGRCRHWMLLGAVLAWGSFYQPDLWLLFTVFTAVYFVFRAVVARPPISRLVKGGAVALAVFFAIGAPSFRSAICSDLAGRDKQIADGETVADSSADDARKRWIFTTNWSMPPEDTLEFIVPRVHGDTSCNRVLAVGDRNGTGVRRYTGRLGRAYGQDFGNYRQHSLYVGRVTCLLALAGLVLAFAGGKTPPEDRRGGMRGTVVFFAVAAFVFWLFSLGRYCESVYRVVFSLPMGDYLRAPVKWHHLTEFCLAVLAGFGIDSLSKLLRPKRAWMEWALAALVLFGVADLAFVDRLYLAPHKAGTELIPTVELGPPLGSPVPESPAEAEAFRREVRKWGAANGMSIYGTNRIVYPLRDGGSHEFKFLVLERKVPAPAPRNPAEAAPLKGFARFAAWLSAFATFAVLTGMCALAFFERRRRWAK